jgi:hypothetical protein
VGLLRVVHV